MARVFVTLPDGSTLYSVTVTRLAMPAAYRKALRMAWKEKRGATALVTFC